MEACLEVWRYSMFGGMEVWRCVSYAKKGTYAWKRSNIHNYGGFLEIWKYGSMQYF